MSEPLSASTVTLTVPAELTWGVVPVHAVSVQVILLAMVLPKSTVLSARWVPVIVTGRPPIVQPLDGDTFVTDGEKKVNLSAAVLALVPPGVLTVTSSVPAFGP